MHRLLSLLLTLSLSVAAVATDLTKYEIKVGDFSELKVTDGVNVDYRCSADSAGYAVFTCRSEVVSSLILSSSGRKLNIQVSTEDSRPVALPRITVYSRYLVKATNAGDSMLRVLDVAGCPKFEASLEGNGSLVVRDIKANELKGVLKLGHGNLVITGECDKAKIISVGTGTIEADGLKVADETVKVSGTGSVGVWATEKLSVFGMGSTTVYYKGNPEIKNRSLGIKVVPLQ